MNSETAYEILDTVPVKDPRDAAEKFGTALALDKGYAFRVVIVNEAVVDLVADDNRAIRFTSK